MKSIFFDLDGTLTDISEKYYRIYAEFMHSVGYPPLNKQSYWRNKRAKVTIGEMLPSDRLMQPYKDFFIDRIENPSYLALDTLFPFSHQVLQSLRKQTLSLYLVTLRRNRANLFDQLKRLGFNQFNDVLTTAPPLFQSYDNYQYKIKLLRSCVKPGDAIVGDTKADIFCGKKLRLVTVGVLSGISNHKVLKTYAPDYIVRDIRSVTSLRGLTS